MDATSEILETASVGTAVIRAKRRRTAEMDAGAEDFVRCSATIMVQDAAVNYALSRTRAYVLRAERHHREQLAKRSTAEQEKILNRAVRALHKLLTSDRFAHRHGLSVPPKDLYSGHHVSDALHLVSEHPRLWRLIALEGVRSGALLFEQWNGFAVVFANPNWRADFAPEPDNNDEVRACVRVMAEPYPATLPDPSWQAGTRVSVEAEPRVAQETDLDDIEPLASARLSYI